MARPVRYHASFKDDLTKRVKWLRINRAPQQRANPARGARRVQRTDRCVPGLGEEIELRGTRSDRRFTIGGPLPYIVWYYYGTANERTPVWLTMLMHDDQDRERFSPERFE